MRKARHITVALAACLFLAAASAETTSSPELSLGRAFDARYDANGIRDAATLYAIKEDEYGFDFYQWPHNVRAAITQRLLDVAPLTGCIISGIPAKSDMADEKAERLAREVIAKAFDHPAVLSQDDYRASIAFDIADSKNPIWSVTLDPVWYVSGQPNPPRYAVRLSRAGEILSLLETAHGAISAHISPLEFLARRMQEIAFAAVNPAQGAPTLENNLALNWLCLFRQYGAMEQHGLPVPNSVPQTEALATAYRVAETLGAYAKGDVSAMRVDVSYLVGDSGHSNELRSPNAYPCWRFIFRDADTGMANFYILIHALRGVPVEYKDNR